MDLTDQQRREGDRRVKAAVDGVSNGADPNPDETVEWLDSLEYVLEHGGIDPGRTSSLSDYLRG